VKQTRRRQLGMITPRSAIALAVLLMVVVFATDLLTQLGFAHGMLYVPVLLLAMTSGQQRALVILCAVSILLIGVGWVFSPPATEGFPAIYVAANRVLSMVVSALVTIIALLYMRHARRLQRARADADRQGQLLQIAGELGQLGAWEFDVRRQVMLWSPEVARLHGRPAGYEPTPDEALGHFEGSDQARIRSLFEACVQRGEPFDDEFRIREAAGPCRWVRVAARPVRNATGKVVRLQGAFQDIGGHKAAERKLDESLRSWRHLAEAMPMMVWTADAAGRQDYASPLVRAYAGDAPGIVRDDGWLSLLHPADLLGAVEAWKQSVETGMQYEHQYRLRRHDGEYRWHLARAQRVQLQPESPAVWYGTTVDIHDQIELEKKSSALAARYEMVLESMTDAVIALDGEWRLTVINAQAETLLQRPRADLLGQVAWDAFPESRGSRFQHEYERAARDGVVIRFEEHFAPLGTLFELTVYPAQAGGVTVYFRDVTEPRRLADQLRQVQRLESIGQLTGSVAHDFNNLLTVVMGNAELLGAHLPEQSLEREMAQTIFEAATRGASMTQRLLAFARKQALSPQPVDINRLIGDMDPLLRQAVGEQVEIKIVSGTGLWQALVDPGQLENALLNLAINARDAMPGGGRLLIETANAWLDAEYVQSNAGVADGAYVLLIVSDNGHGMKPDVMRQMFEPFFTTKPKGRGTGLGLSMVHGFVKQSNGHVAVYSEPGSGTTIRLYLPRIEGPALGLNAPQTADVPMGRGECVLLVEDDELVRQYAMTLLLGMGYRVLIAQDGQQALNSLQEHPEVQLLFTDVVMPGAVGGRELADRAQAMRPGLPVLFTSGYTENGIVHHGRLDPGVLLLAKPYRRSELARSVRQALEGASAGEPDSVRPV
jgi:PAS domain S-box-containing protein